MHSNLRFSGIITSLKLSALPAVLVALVSCQTTGHRSENAQFPEKALQYRMFKLPAAPRSDSSADDASLSAQSAIEVSYFKGLLTQADETKIFDASARFRQDRNGNRVSPVIAVDGTLMSVLRGKRAVNWLARSPGGVISSSVDADGDGVVDMLDSITANRDRFIIVNGLGLELLKNWRNGIDPLCQPLPGFGGQPLFGCDDSGSPAGTSRRRQS